MDMNRPHILAALGVAVLTLACQDDQPRRVAAPPDAQRSDSVLSLTVSSLKPDVGSRITVTASVARRASFKPVGSFKAHLRYDPSGDRKSTRLNSSHQIISYAVFCLK